MLQVIILAIWSMADKFPQFLIVYSGSNSPMYLDGRQAQKQWRSMEVTILWYAKMDHKVGPH